MMNPTYNLYDIIEWDISNWSVALGYWNKNTRHDLVSSWINALKIGAWHGWLSLWAASNGIKVLCSDLEYPSKAIEKNRYYNVSHLIEYAALDALSIPDYNKFDIVIFKSVLGGIGRQNNRTDQAKAIKEIYKCLREGGELWFAENLVASPFHQVLRRRYVKWGNSWRYVTIQEMREFLLLF